MVWNTLHAVGVRERSNRCAERYAVCVCMTFGNERSAGASRFNHSGGALCASFLPQLSAALVKTNKMKTTVVLTKSTSRVRASHVLWQVAVCTAA